MTDKQLKEKYDTELRENDEWSVYVLPQAEPVFNAYVPPLTRRYYNRSAIMKFCVNVLHTLETTGHPYKRRLLELHSIFDHIATPDFVEYVDKSIELYNKGDTEIIPNAMVRSIHNPYFVWGPGHGELGYPTSAEKKQVRHEHRMMLKNMGSWYKDEIAIEDFCSDWDCEQGAIRLGHIIEGTGISRYKVDRALKRRPDLKEMFDKVKELSMTPQQLKRKIRYEKESISDRQFDGDL